MLKILLDKVISCNHRGYSFLAGIFERISKQSQEREIDIDFSNCQHFDANLSAALGAILDKLAEERYAIWLTNLNSVGVRRILSRNHFAKEWTSKCLLSKNTEPKET